MKKNTDNNIKSEIYKKTRVPIDKVGRHIKHQKIAKQKSTNVQRLSANWERRSFVRDFQIVEKKVEMT